MFYLKFRAAWRRICGKEKPNLTINETTINQLSVDTSSKVHIECSFMTFDKKTRKQQKNKLINNSNLFNNQADEICASNLNLNINNKLTNVKTKMMSNEMGNSYELRSFIFDSNNNNDRFKTGCEMKMFSSEVNIYGRVINKVVNKTYKSNLF